jgi:hypothetical protein
MTLVINQFLDQQSLDDEIHAQDPSDTSDENPPESTMPFWDWCVESDDEQIEEILTGDTQVVKVIAPKGYNLCNKGPPSDPPSSKEENIPLRKITPPPVLPKQSNTVLEKTNNKTGKTVVANKDKPSMSSTIGNNEKVIQGKSGQAKDDSNLHALYYNVIEDMKKIKANISMFDIFSLPQQRELLHDAFKPHETWLFKHCIDLRIFFENLYNVNEY